MMSAYDEEARAAFAVNRAIEMYGAPCANFKDTTKKGVARLLARLDMIRPEQIMMDEFIWTPSQGSIMRTEQVAALVDDCKTAGCLAGWTVLEHASQLGGNGAMSPQHTAARMLGLSLGEKEALFFPRGWDDNKLTHEEAKQTVIRFWQTGQISWGPD